MSEEKGSEKKEGAEGEKNTRWWEQYYVRYFVGTIFGAAVLIAVRGHALLWELRAVGSGEGVELWKELAALATVGLAYCYLASVPVLTLHAVRGVFDLRSKVPVIVLGAMLLLLLGVIVAVNLLDQDMRRDFDHVMRRIVGLGMLIAIGGGQFVLICIFTVRSRRFVKFYRRLAVSRKEGRAQGLDVVDSYRHLREHGNAVSIVLLEMLLGLILSAVNSMVELFAALSIWLLPAAYTWVIGSILERAFADNEIQERRSSGSTNRLQS